MYSVQEEALFSLRRELIKCKSKTETVKKILFKLNYFMWNNF